MEFYVRLSKVPEMAHLTRAQRTEVWGATAGRRLKDPFILVGLVILLVVMAPAYYLGHQLLPWKYGAILGAAVGGGIGNFLFMGLMTPRARPILAAEILRRGW